MLLVFTTRAAFVYHGGMPEPDSVVMAAGMAKGMMPGVGLGDATLYGRQLSPAMYALVDAVYPVFFDTPGHLIAFLNWMAVLAASLMVLPLVAVLRRHMPDHAAAGVVLLAAFSPVVWEWGTYFHPLVPAVLLLLLGIAAAGRVRATAPGLAWMAVVLLCAAAAMIVRAEVLFVVPAIFFWSLVAPGARRRRIAVVTSAVVVALVCYGLVLRALPASTESPSHGLRGYVAMIYSMYLGGFSLAGLTRSATWAVLAIGVATLAVACRGLIADAIRSARRSAGATRWGEGHALVASALVWIFPSVVFWLPQPTPIMRHYVLAALGLAWLVGYLVLRPLTPRRAFAVVAVVVAVNLGLPESAYRVYNSTHPGHAKFPHGAFFYEQQAERAEIARHAAMAEVVVDDARGAGTAVLVNWTGYAYVLYRVYAGAHDVEHVSLERPNPNVSCERFRVDGADLLVVQAIRLAPGNPPARAVRDCLDVAVDRGMRVIVPAEAASAGFTGAGLGTEVVTY